MHVVVMGVTGSGKTTVGRLLAERLGWKFYDADDFHPAENVEKMRSGVPLDDADRKPWLKRLARLISTEEQNEHSVVLACSALKREYRNLLTPSDCDLRFVFLEGDFELIHSRLHARVGHYMDPNLLESQFAALEIPEQSEKAIHFSIGPQPEEIVQEVCRKLELSLAA